MRRTIDITSGSGKWILLGIAVVLIHVVGLSQFPTASADEGFWAGGARNYALFGDALMDGRLHPFLSPGMFTHLAAVFSVVAPDLVSARMMSVLAGVGAWVLMVVIAVRHFGARNWLVPVFFGFSYISIVTHRIVLLEALETFWLVLAAYFWLSSRKHSWLPAGIAMAVALLVKSNSIYLIPVFLLTPAILDGRRAWSRLAAFMATVVILAGGAYFLLWRMYPENFVQAFFFELDGQRLTNSGVLFQVGRFGLNPPQALEALVGLAQLDVILVAAALVGLVVTVRGLFAAGTLLPARRADSFFFLWLIFGGAFIFGQIHVQTRYLTTLIPAMAWSAGRLVDAFLDRVRPSGSYSRLAIAGVALFCVANLVRAGVGIHRHYNENYWSVVDWMKTHAPAKDRALGAPYINLSLPQQSYDFFRMLIPYRGERRDLGSVVSEYRIGWIIQDSEWRQYETPRDRDYLSRNCVSTIRLTDADICRLPAP